MLLGYGREVYYFSYHGLEKDLQERVLNRAVDHRHRPQALLHRQQLLNTLKEAHQRQLKKIIYYNVDNEVTSYLRIDSRPESEAKETKEAKDIHLTVYYYTPTINPQQHDFHHLTFDARGRSPEGRRESLKEVHTFCFNQNRIKSFFKEELNSRTGRMLKRKGISPEQSYFEKLVLPTKGSITRQFVEELISLE